MATIPSLKTLLGRGWRKKCPRCGEGKLFKHFVTLNKQCPVCSLKYLPNQGDLIGPLILIDRVVFLVPLVTLFCFGLPHVSRAVYYSVCGLVLLLFVVTLPNRNGMSVAFDYYLDLKRDKSETKQDNP